MERIRHEKTALNREQTHQTLHQILHAYDPKENFRSLTMPHALTTRESMMESKPVGSYEPTGIDVLVIGTGLGGLVAILECVRKGHNVRVLERNADINTLGTALNVES